MASIVYVVSSNPEFWYHGAIGLYLNVWEDPRYPEAYFVNIEYHNPSGIFLWVLKADVIVMR